MRKRSAFSLVELLVTIAIIALISALVFPVLANAKRAGHSAASTQHLRQIGMAIHIYNETYGGYPSNYLGSLVDVDLITDERLFVSGTDAVSEGYGTAMSDCMTNGHGTELLTSYESIFYPAGDASHAGGLLRWIMQFDTNPGVVVDRTIGAGDPPDGGKGDHCQNLLFRYHGDMLRLRMDGSVQHAHFSILPAASDGPYATHHFSRLRLFTDEEAAYPGYESRK